MSGRSPLFFVVTPSIAPGPGGVDSGQIRHLCPGAPGSPRCIASQQTGLIFSSLLLAGGIGFGRAKGNSGSEADDETQLTFYTEQYRSRRRSKGTTRYRYH